MYHGEAMKQIIVPEYIKGLIFDCDGTLVDSMPTHMKAWEHAITYFNAPWNYDFVYERKGQTTIGIVDDYNRYFGTNLIGDQVSMVKQEYFRKINNDTQPIKEVVDVVYRYKNILPMAVASGGSRENVTAQLKAAGLIEFFPIILTGDDPVKTKPAPDIFLEAARRMNIPPHLCQVFEDGDLGLEGAEKAGMLTTDVRLFGV
jgi:HAD superfamily hydrolase (TIGR01509 family)